MQVFYVKDMANKPKKNQGKSDDEPKRHIVLLGKRKIIGVENISDKSEYFYQFDDRPPFFVDVDPIILLSKEDTPYIRPRSQSRDIRKKQCYQCSIKQ